MADQVVINQPVISIFVQAVFLNTTTKVKVKKKNLIRLMLNIDLG